MNPMRAAALTCALLLPVPCLAQQVCDSFCEAVKRSIIEASRPPPSPILSPSGSRLPAGVEEAAKQNERREAEERRNKEIDRAARAERDAEMFRTQQQGVGLRLRERIQYYRERIYADAPAFVRGTPYPYAPASANPPRAVDDPAVYFDGTIQANQREYGVTTADLGRYGATAGLALLDFYHYLDAARADPTLTDEMINGAFEAAVHTLTYCYAQTREGDCYWLIDEVGKLVSPEDRSRLKDFVASVSGALESNSILDRKSIHGGDLMAHWQALRAAGASMGIERAAAERARLEAEAREAAAREADRVRKDAERAAKEAEDAKAAQRAKEEYERERQEREKQEADQAAKVAAERAEAARARKAYEESAEGVRVKQERDAYWAAQKAQEAALAAQTAKWAQEMLAREKPANTRVPRDRTKTPSADCKSRVSKHEAAPHDSVEKLVELIMLYDQCGMTREGLAAARRLFDANGSYYVFKWVTDQSRPAERQREIMGIWFNLLSVPSESTRLFLGEAARQFDQLGDHANALMLYERWLEFDVPLQYAVDEYNRLRQRAGLSAVDMEFVKNKRWQSESSARETTR